MRVVIAAGADGIDRELESALVDFGVDWSVQWMASTDPAVHEHLLAADVLVADARAPGGIGLLQRARLSNPKAVRILVLGERDESSAMRALEATHRFLRRPLSADDIVSAVDSVVELQEILGAEDVKEAVGRIGRLPPPPRLYLELHRKLEDPDASTVAISGLIAQDPAIAVKVLRLCNSAYFAYGRKVGNIRSAVIRLGQDSIRRLVLAGEVFSMPAPQGVDRDALSRRAVVASRLASRLLGGAGAELAATAAVIAEVGMLLPGVRIPDEPGLPPTRGPHYAEAGAYLLGLWGLPLPIVEAVANHRHPRRNRFRGFWIGGAVHVATSLAAGYPLDDDYLREQGLTGRVPQWKEMAEAIRAARIDA